MTSDINCIMLIDDNADDNFYHERVIRNYFGTKKISVVAEQTPVNALKYLKSAEQRAGAHPDLVFLDINMPGMNGWEFLEQYNKLEKKFQCSAIVVMLTTSDNPDDIRKAKQLTGISDFKSKPLTRQILEDIVQKYFAENKQ